MHMLQYQPLPLKVLILFFDLITSNLPTPTVIALSHTHTLLIDKFAAYLRGSFDALLAFRISRRNISGFRKLLLETRAVISGSTALHFILREKHWKPGDFDLYAPFGTGYAVVRWLMVHEGYRIISDGSRNFMFRPHTIHIPTIPTEECNWLTDFRLNDTPAAHRTPVKRDVLPYVSTGSNIYRVYKLSLTANTSIDVIESSKPSFLPPITKFHSTLVMNYLTPESMVILYPSLTFKREGILQLRDENTPEPYNNPNEQSPSNITAPTQKEDYVEKYEARGFTLYSRPEDLHRPCGAACPARLRKVDTHVDKWALEVKFGPRNITHNITEESHPSVAHDEDSSTNSAYAPPIATSSSSSFSSQWSYLFSQAPLNVPLETGQGTNVTYADIPMPCRPPLPSTSWLLRSAPPQASEPPGMLACYNPFCPLRDLQ